MERRWISVKETASYLNLHLKTIYRLVSRGAIPFSKIPGYEVRIDKTELDRYLESFKQSPVDWRERLGDWLAGERSK
ncbi:MAG: hypothetical protein AMJ89_02650 [candidate division Zixibacteria bacterium SM23_73]|nr:MAG: hypothetical protein AMJ89_02650 [candidate division Zixibacteria bacterium SM23_73]